MEVIHDSAFWRDLSRARGRPAEKNGGAEYRVEKTDSGFAISGPALGKPSFFKSEDKALSLARHIIGPKGGSIVRIAGNGKTNSLGGMNNRRVNADDFAARIDERPAGIAGI